MAYKFANIIIDISHEKVDRTFQYRIPPKLAEQIQVGIQVFIPFGSGNHQRKGYVVGLTDQAEYDTDKLKEIAGVVADGVTAQSQLIQLAWWMKEQFGSTMNQALKTVLPVKQKMKPREKKTIVCLLDREHLEQAVVEAEKKHFKARSRLLHAFLQVEQLPYEMAVQQLNITAATLKPLLEQKILKLETSTVYRNPISMEKLEAERLALTKEQRFIVEDFCKNYDQGERRPSLIYGVTGSGKTQVYLELIQHVRDQGKQVIVLIPEIALTYQTVLRFYRRFGDQVSIINSRLSAGERYDQLERAKNGEVSIMIGPRSALFTPFSNLGLILMDEEHEGAYKSEVAPRYHAREVAQELARMNHAALVLGSATPSMESYTRAVEGEYCLYTLKHRAKADSQMAKVSVVDLREELKAGNKSIFSRELYQRMEECLASRQQIMLFMNRRGYANFVSCRSCGEAVKCPHCDVSLTLHYGNRLVCHYCGHETPVPKHCPSCGSPYIASFGAGTQKIEELTRQLFPKARILRMDLDTTSKKGGHEEILSAFARQEADILIGTQMIVKGHDFPNVTLVGVMAADLSLHTPDYRCSERTFQLLTQAAGRAGRDQFPGTVVIQTYCPDHYSIVTAASQDYDAFYRQEMAYRRMLSYPPVCHLLTIQISSASEEILQLAADSLSRQGSPLIARNHGQMIGPAEASIYKVNDIYRKILYIKHENYDILIQIQTRLEEAARSQEWFSHVLFQYDYS